MSKESIKGDKWDWKKKVPGHFFVKRSMNKVPGDKLMKNYKAKILIITLYFLMGISVSGSDIGETAPIKVQHSQNIYKFSEKIEFKVKNLRKKPYIAYFGIKVKIETGWKIIAKRLLKRVEDENMSGITFQPGQTLTIEWDKHVSVPPQIMGKYKKFTNTTKENDLITYEVRKGGFFQLYLWEVTPYVTGPLGDRGIHFKLWEFELSPQSECTEKKVNENGCDK